MVVTSMCQGGAATCSRVHLEVPFLGEQATKVPGSPRVPGVPRVPGSPRNGNRISPDSLTSLSTDSWLVGKQTHTRSSH